MGIDGIDLEIEEMAEQDAAGAIAHLRALVERHPQNGDAWYTLGGLLDQEGLESEAIPCYERALCLSPEPPWKPNAYLQLASSYRNVGRLDEAKALLEAGLRQFPELTAQAVFLAFVEFDRGDHRTAVRTLIEMLLSFVPQALEPYTRAIRYYKDLL